MGSKAKPPAILITGASTGIGEATALELDRRGYRVFAGVRCEEAGKGLQDRSKGLLTPILLDVTDQSHIANAVETIRNSTGECGLAGLVNNAGIAVSGPLEIIPEADFRRQMEVNLFGSLAMIRAFIPQLRICGGRIVNISSINGALSAPYLGPYSASKFALEAISDSLRIELRQWGIKVIVIAPGAIKTPIWDKSVGTSEKMVAEVPPEELKRYENDLNAWRKAVVNIAEAGDPVEKVVECIVKALTAPRPRARYYLHFSQRFICRGFKILPEWIRDWFVRRAVGLK
jgi:NAD(P)-dependent dehydrogenase (short-subunit alcohol dehydrogenase family)